MTWIWPRYLLSAQEKDSYVFLLIIALALLSQVTLWRESGRSGGSYYLITRPRPLLLHVCNLLVSGDSLGERGVDLVSKALSGSLLVCWGLSDEGSREVLGVVGGAGQRAASDSINADLLEVGLDGDESSRDGVDGGGGTGEGRDDRLGVVLRDGLGVGLDVSCALLDGSVEVAGSTVDGKGGEVVLRRVERGEMVSRRPNASLCVHVSTHGAVLLLEGLRQSSGLLVNVGNVRLDGSNVSSDEHGERQDGNESGGEELHGGSCVRVW